MLALTPRSSHSARPAEHAAGRPALCSGSRSSKKKHAQTWRRSVVSALVEPRRGPGDSWGCTGRPRGARLQDQDAQRPCLEGSVFARGHSPLLSAFPDGRPASRRRRRVAFSSRGGEGGALYGLPQAESLGEPGAQGRVDTAGRRALPPPHPTVPPPSLRSWLLARSCARARSLSLQSLLRAQYPLRFVPEGRSITCPVLTDFRIREKAFIPSEFSPSLRAHGLKPLLE